MDALDDLRGRVGGGVGGAGEVIGADQDDREEWRLARELAVGEPPEDVLCAVPPEAQVQRAPGPVILPPDPLAPAGKLGVALKEVGDGVADENEIVRAAGGLAALGLVARIPVVEVILEFRDREDGSAGVRGRVTDVLDEIIERQKIDLIYSCGPMAMLAAVQRIAQSRGIAHQISVEESMACGIGICMTCVIPMDVDGETKLLRSCIEGPVLDANSIDWGRIEADRK